MATSENALPKLLRDYLTQSGFNYDRVKTTPNFTYDVTRVIKTPVDQEFDPQTEGVAYDTEILAALQGFDVTQFKVISVAYDEMTPPQDEDVRMHRLTARVKAQNYEPPAPVFKEKVEHVKKERAVKETKTDQGPEGLRVLINLGGETQDSAKESKPKASKKAGGKKGIVQPAVTEAVDAEELAQV